MSEDFERVQVKEYDGSVESLKDLVDKLNWKYGEYYLDINTMKVTNARLGLIYRVGDHYMYPINNETFEAIA